MDGSQGRGGWDVTPLRASNRVGMVWGMVYYVRAVRHANC